MQNPYNYTFEEEKRTYQFITKNDITYSVAFLEDETLNSVSTTDIEITNVYQVIIVKVSDEIEPLDSLVRLTIDNIINDFFKSRENSLIYVCSHEQDKDQIRSLVFERWYQSSQHKDVITKIDNIIPMDDNSTLYTSLLYHNDNPNINYILTSFNEIEEALNKEEE